MHGAKSTAIETAWTAANPLKASWSSHGGQLFLHGSSVIGFPLVAGEYSCKPWGLVSAMLKKTVWGGFYVCDGVILDWERGDIDREVDEYGDLWRAPIQKSNEEGPTQLAKKINTT